MSLTILHASDIHFGKHFDPDASDAFLRFLWELSPDLLVLSGDLTQRAKVREYRSAGDFLAKVAPIPVVVTPGNHDVPLYRVWERLFSPHRNYRTFISGALDTATHVPGATVVALDSTAPRTAIVNGRITDRQLRFAARAFRDAHEGDIRILVTHHNLSRAPDYGPEQVLPGHRRYLEAFSGMGVELILGGHLHRAYVATSFDVFPQDPSTPPLVMVYSGTTTSRRGRVRERGVNSLNVLRVSEKEVRIETRLRRSGHASFQTLGTHVIPREGKERK
jgi:3',5'-cyclic AMP phosphodiesterase CpdA